jgi:hypothetical protein
MQFSESWLRQFVNPAIDSKALGHAMTMAGLEVEEQRSVVLRMRVPVSRSHVHSLVLSYHPQKRVVSHFRLRLANYGVSRATACCARDESLV